MIKRSTYTFSGTPKIVGSGTGSTEETTESTEPSESETKAKKDKENPDKILSYPTVGAMIFDVPEPSSIDGKFIYNYF